MRDADDLCHPIYRALGWAVHGYTASGAMLGLLAIEFSATGRFRAAFVAMALATVIDSSDGPLARGLRLQQLIPQFDGALLDNLVDYLTYVIAPVFLMLRAQLMPVGWAGWLLATAVVISSAFGFSRVNAKTADNYFLGFPSYWNLVAFYLYCFAFSRTINAVIMLVLVALVWVPSKYIYPNRTLRLRRLTLILAALWAVLVAIILFELPHPKPLLVWCSFGFIGYYLVISCIFSIQGRRALVPP